MSDRSSDPLRVQTGNDLIDDLQSMRGLTC